MQSLLRTCSTFSTSMRGIALILRMCRDLAYRQLWLRQSDLVAASHPLQVKHEADRPTLEAHHRYIDHRLL